MKHTYQTVIAIFLILFLLGAIHAKGQTISGNMLDKDTGKPNINTQVHDRGGNENSRMTVGVTSPYLFKHLTKNYMLICISFFTLTSSLNNGEYYILKNIK
jgi:hypothetical protein